MHQDNVMRLGNGMDLAIITPGSGYQQVCTRMPNF